MKSILFLFLFSNLLLSQVEKVQTSKEQKKTAKSKDYNKIPRASLIKGTVPLEFELIYNYVRRKLPRKRRLELLKLTHELSVNFQKVPIENLMFFIKAEVYRSLIQFEFDVYVQKIDINPSFLLKLEQRIQASKGLYDDFAVFILTSLINDFDPYMDSPVFKNLAKVNKANEGDMKLAAEIRRKLKYLNKWFYIADKYDPDRFNKITYEVAWKVLYNLKSYVEVLGYFSGRLFVEEPVAFFDLPPIPEQNVAENIFNLEPDYSEINSLEKIALEEQMKGQKIVQGLTPPEMQQPPVQIPAGQDLNSMGEPAYGVPAYGQIPLDPNIPIDPNTGLPYDPATGYPIDPATGQIIDPNTGMPIDPSMIHQDPNQMMAQDPNAPTQIYDPYNQGYPVDPNQGPMLPGAEIIPGNQMAPNYMPQQGYMPGQDESQGELPWIPDEYGDQLQGIEQQSDFIDTPDGKKYKDGVYIVPNGGAVKSDEGTETSDSDDDF